MRLKFINSACIELTTSDITILMDPWFTDGIYDGSWYQFPKIDPFQFISKPDLIYISHIHPDHYDPVFLKQLFKKFGQIPIIIPDLENNYLMLRGKFDGFELQPTRDIKIGNTQISVRENLTDSLSDIDSAIFVYDAKNKKSFLNLNDNIYNENHVRELKAVIGKYTQKLDILALGYLGAGPYPQTFYDHNEEEQELKKKAEWKKNKFFESYKKFSDTYSAEVNLPFAGDYHLGGKLTHLNKFRGNPDAIEVKEFDKKAVVLDAGGQIDLLDGSIKGERLQAFSEKDALEYYKEIKGNLMKYEKDIKIDFSEINFMRLLKSALYKAKSKSEYTESYHFIFSITHQEQAMRRFCCEIQTCNITELKEDENIHYDQFTEIIIDYRYLFGLLVGIYHWDNAAVGSHYMTRRTPRDNYQKAIVNYLNFFAVL